ncbi:hypothetical protein SRABI96_01537 [Peribacillus sp. Bi96]|nr:hypothetical protein SRABI96_01537 [Peribacillus sp. Bi96]
MLSFQTCENQKLLPQIQLTKHQPLFSITGSNPIKTKRFRNETIPKPFCLQTEAPFIKGVFLPPSLRNLARYDKTKIIYDF